MKVLWDVKCVSGYVVRYRRVVVQSKLLDPEDKEMTRGLRLFETSGTTSL